MLMHVADTTSNVDPALDALPPPRLHRRRSAWSRCDEAVARIAPTSTTTCQVCSEAIVAGDWQLGLMFIHVEGFMLMEWHHVACAACVPGLSLEDLVAMARDGLSPDQSRELEALCKRVTASPRGVDGSRDHDNDHDATADMDSGPLKPPALL